MKCNAFNQNIKVKPKFTKNLTQKSYKLFQLRICNFVFCYENKKCINLNQNLPCLIDANKKY